MTPKEFTFLKRNLRGGPVSRLDGTNILPYSSNFVDAIGVTANIFLQSLKIACATTFVYYCLRLFLMFRA